MRRLIKSLFKHFIVYRPSRLIINFLANHLGWNFRSRLHGAFGYAFKDYRGQWEDDVWNVNFLNSTIKAPLRASNLTNDWVAAMTLLLVFAWFCTMILYLRASRVHRE